MIKRIFSHKNTSNQGVTLLEALVTMMVMTIGFIGMAGVMLQTMKARTVRKHYKNALRLTQSKMSQLTHVDYTLLATGATPADKELYGAANEEIVFSALLNKEGQIDDSTTDPPFLFSRSFVVCLDDADGGATAAGDGSSPCTDLSANRPNTLSCDTSETLPEQAILRVMTTYRDRNGMCHKATLQRVIVNYN